MSSPRSLSLSAIAAALLAVAPQAGAFAQTPPAGTKPAVPAAPHPTTPAPRSVSVTPSTPKPAADLTPVPGSKATLEETLQWLLGKATLHEDGVSFDFPTAPQSSGNEGNDDNNSGSEPAPANLVFSTDQKVRYDAPNHQLVIEQRAGRPGGNAAASFMQMTTCVPLDKLDVGVRLDNGEPCAVVLSCVTPGKFFRETGMVMGHHVDDYVGEISVRFDSVNTAERAVRAFAHLATLTSGKGPVKPASEPF